MASCQSIRGKSRLTSISCYTATNDGHSSLTFVIPTAAEGSAVLSTSIRFAPKRRPPLCHPERTRISYYAAPKMTSFAAFIKESRMSFVEPTGLSRKSGAAEGSAVPWTFLGNVFRRSEA
jgi:hypothetical protein